MGEFDVRTYDGADAPAVLELLHSAFGDWPGPRVAARDQPADFFQWKHAGNPRGQSFILLAEGEPGLIGMRAYMQWPLRVAGRPVSAVQAVDIATHPEHQGRGVNSALTKRAIEVLSRSGPLSLGVPNDRSRSLSRKVGWRAVGPLPLWGRVLRPGRVLRGLRSLRTPTEDWPAPPPIEAPAAVDGLGDAGAVAELLRDSAADGERFASERSAADLRWRFAPMLADYHAVSEEDGGRLAGLAIFRLRPRGRLWEASVCELLARPGDHRTVARLLRSVAAAGAADYIAVAPAAGTGQARSLARAGLVRAPLGGANLGVTPYREVTPDPFERSSWSLSLGDLERLTLC